MYILPLVFLFNTVLFVVLLEERFKFVTTASVGFISYLLSLLANTIVTNVLPNPNLIEPTSNIINLFILLLASVFLASNNLPQKIFLAISLHFNFIFVAQFVPNLLGVSPFEVSNFIHILLINVIFALVCLIYAAIFWAPLHYFYRTFSFSTVGLCIIQLLACIVCSGVVPKSWQQSAADAPLASGIFLYCIVIFCARSIYDSAKHKADDIHADANDKVLDAWADNFNSMLAYVNTQKHLSQSFSYQTKRIAQLTKEENYDEVVNLTEDFQKQLPKHPLLADYCENPHINALIATKTTQASSKGVAVKSNINFNDSPVSLIILCSIMDLILNMGIEESEKVEAESKQISLNVQSTGNSLNVEGIFPSVFVKREKFDITKKTFQEIIQHFLKYLFTPKSSINNDKMDSLLAITAKYNGNLTQSQTAEEFMIKIKLKK